MLYNGITVFDLGPGSRSGDAAAAEKGSEMVLYNGITFFDQGKTASEAKGSAAEEYNRTDRHSNLTTASLYFKQECGYR